MFFILKELISEIEDELEIQKRSRAKDASKIILCLGEKTTRDSWRHQ
jgi:hypothetical protein